jgi:processive 1,2-diacylglycerol beta-glucosyltransferase
MDSLPIIFVLVLIVLGVPRLRAGRHAPVPQQAHFPRRNGRLKVLVLSAAIGGGHDAASRGICEELERAGHRAVVVDGLRGMNPAVAWFIRGTYTIQLRYAPWLYEILFRLQCVPAVASVLRLGVGMLFGRQLLRTVQRERPDVVIPTYPLVIATLGFLRRTGKLGIPVVALISDYGTHPLWVAPGVDHYLVMSRASSALAERAGGRVQVIRPPITYRFRSALGRRQARAALGLPPDAFVALIVGGSWGVGDLVSAAEYVVESGAHAMIVTGRNAALKSRLQKRFGHVGAMRVFGWTSDMPLLMAASDCLIQNAGGVTCLEAAQIGLPVLLFRPIPGHGLLNAKVMDRAGAARLVRSAEELKVLLDLAVARTITLAAPRREPGCSLVAAIVGCTTVPSPQPGPTSRIRQLLPAPVLAVASTLAMAFWLTSTPLGVALAAKGLHMHIPGYDPPSGQVAVGVRATDPTTARVLERLIEQGRQPIALFVNARGADGLYPSPDILFGVAEDPDNGRISTPWEVRREARYAATELHRSTGVWPDYFLPASGELNVAALAIAPLHALPVMPEYLDGQGPGPGLLIIDASGLAPEEAKLLLQQEIQAIQEKGLRWVPLDEL